MSTKEQIADLPAEQKLKLLKGILLSSDTVNIYTDLQVSARKRWGVRTQERIQGSFKNGANSNKKGQKPA